MIRPARALAVAVLAAGAASGPASAAELPLSERHVMSVGHADVMNVVSRDGRLLMDVKDDSGEEPVQRDPGEVILHAKPESRAMVPDHPDYTFLGVPGDPVWIMPEVQQDDILWPGWETEGVSAAEFPGDTLTWRLLDLQGPAQLSVFVTTPFGTPIVFLDTAHPLPLETPISNRSHTHANWAFEAEGLYRMTVEVTGLRPGGRPVSTGPVTYTWFVGDLADLPPDDAPPPPPPGGDVPPGPDGTPPPPPAGGPPPADPPALPALRAAVDGRGLRLGSARRAGAVRLRCRLDGAGTCAVRASIAAGTARRLRLRVPRGAADVAIGRGSATLGAPGTAGVRIALDRRGRTALRRAGRRLRVRLAVTATGAGRPPASSRTSVVLTR